MMHGKSKLRSLKTTYDEANSTMTAAEFIQSSVLPGASTELHRKTMGIRAYKAFTWLGADNTRVNLLITTACLAPLERIMFTFLGWQRDNLFLMDVPSPIAIMSTPSSPARQAVTALYSLMAEGKLMSVSDPRVRFVDLMEGLEMFGAVVCRQLVVILSCIRAKTSPKVFRFFTLPFGC